MKPNDQKILEENAADILSEIFKTDEKESNSTEKALKLSKERKQNIKAEKENLKKELKNKADEEIKEIKEKLTKELEDKKVDMEENSKKIQDRIEELFNKNGEKYLNELFEKTIS